MKMMVVEVITKQRHPSTYYDDSSDDDSYGGDDGDDGVDVCYDDDDDDSYDYNYNYNKNKNKNKNEISSIANSITATAIATAITITKTKTKVNNNCHDDNDNKNKNTTKVTIPLLWNRKRRTTRIVSSLFTPLSHQQRIGLGQGQVVLLLLLFVLLYNMTTFQDCIVVSASVSVSAPFIELNDQLMPRVTERIDDYLQKPVTAARNLYNFHKIGGFRSAADRIALFQYILSTSITSRESSYPVEVYISLEDGVHVSYQTIDSQEYITYREPGNSGYQVDTIDSTDPNYKYYKACFNKSNGLQEDCLMWEGDPYIECINDCELIPCPKTNTTTNTTTTTTTSNETIVDNEKNTTNNNTTIPNNTTETIWCTNYVRKEVQIGEERGYIPTVDLCINPYGIPEQRIGHVMLNFATNTIGTCYYVYSEDEVVVNQTLVGDYAACGGNGAICDNTFHGAQYHSDYDTRTRPFHQKMKQRLVPEWREPFFYSFARTLTIGYEHPLFLFPSDTMNDYYDTTTTTNNNTTTTTTTTNKKKKKNTIGKKIFDGVVAIDYELSELSNFLRTEFLKTSIQLIIVEETEPYYLIASSYHQYQVKYVLLTDETKPCPDEYIDDYGLDEEQCTSIRIPVSDLSISTTTTTTTTTSNNIDIVLYRAFMAHQKQNFPIDTIVNIKESDAIGSQAYATQGKWYNLPSSTTFRWYVVATLPMERSTNDTAMVGDTSFTVICCIGIFGFIGCFYLFLKFYSRRKERAMVQADWRFTCAFILGCAFLNLSTLTLLGENTNSTCMLRMWSFNGLFACALSPLFVKVWRMASLLTASRTFKRVSMTNFTAFLYTLPLIVIQLLLLMIFSFVDPPRQTEQLGVGIGIGVQQITCEQQTNAFTITQIVFDGFLIFVGCVLAYRTRDLDPKFGEAKQLGFSMYNIAFTGIVCIATMNLVELDQLSRMVLQAVGVFWASFFCSFSFVLPRLLEAAKERKSQRDSISDSISNISMTGFQKISGLEGTFSKYDNDNTSTPFVDNSYSPREREPMSDVFECTRSSAEQSTKNKPMSFPLDHSTSSTNEAGNIVFEKNLSDTSVPPFDSSTTPTSTESKNVTIIPDSNSSEINQPQVSKTGYTGMVANFIEGISDDDKTKSSAGNNDAVLSMENHISPVLQNDIEGA